jgi:uncharacterized protein YegP (UPF0339 family)
MAGKCALKKTGAGEYDFVLKASNSDIIAASESYMTKAAGKTKAPAAKVDDESGE